MNVFFLFKKIVKSLIYSLLFYLKAPKNEPMLVTLPRSGTHLTIALLNVCYSIRIGFPGIVGVNDDNYSTFGKIEMPLDDRSIYTIKKFPFLWHSHLPYSKIIPRRKKFCKIIVLIREPVEALSSLMLHIINSRKKKININRVPLKKFQEFDRENNLINRYVSFIESWKNEKKKNKTRIFIIDNKFIKKNTKKYLLFLNKFYGFKFTKNEMNSALAQLNIKRIKKISSSKSQRITKNRIIFSKDVQQYILKKCNKSYFKIYKFFEANKTKL